VRGSRSAPERRVTSLRKLGWDAWAARCKGNACCVRATVGRLIALVGWVHGRVVFLVDSRDDECGLWARWNAPAGAGRDLRKQWTRAWAAGQIGGILRRFTEGERW
jgi:hypothetical protein